MKKLLIAAAAVGAAASVAALYLRKTRQGQRLMEEGADLAHEAQDTIRKYVRKSKKDGKQIYSSAMD